MLNEERCWRAVVERDSTQDGQFFFGVETTGIFCRPSCSARRPLRKNVRFFPDAEAAERHGLRACRRCHPKGEPENALLGTIRELCAYIETHCDSGDPLTLETLSQRSGLPASRLRRAFRKLVGVTPRQYVEACRFGQLKESLREDFPVTDAIYQAGFGSSSQVYEQTGDRLGMTPGAYRAGGRGQVLSYAHAATPFGPLLLAATDRGLCFAQFGESESELRERLRKEFPRATLRSTAAAGDAQLAAWLQALEKHLEGDEPHPTLPVDVRATAFQQRVWSFLRKIPYGETRTYSQVAEGIGQPRAVRAVASACARNRVAIAIPCHRVIRADGGHGGYRWGAERKRALLEQEAALGGRKARRAL